MRDLEFDSLVRQVSKRMEVISGNQLGEKQYPMVTSRLKRRLMDLKISGAKEYLEYLRVNEKSEMEYLLGLLTTHHTFFFREFSQIMMLEQHLGMLSKELKKNGQSQLRVWSAACSFGHEAYTLAMFLEKHWVQKGLGASYKILGTDIDPEAVKRANNGVYKKTELDKVPIMYSQGHWQKGKSERLADYVRVNSSLRSKCEFKTHNLMESPRQYGKFDIILVRNVLIYFNAEVNAQVSKQLESALAPHGVIVCGVSETLDTKSSSLKKVSPSMYGKTSFAVPEEKPAEKKAAKIKRVLCVDDSKIVLKLMKTMITKDRGFEVVGVAMNGLEAQKQMKVLKPDVVTLDLHMPEMDGIQYLEANMNPSHPPVLVVSSAERGDTKTALRALELGASDFVQKPAMSDLDKSGEEICQKLRSILEQKNTDISLEKQFSHNATSRSQDSNHWVCVLADPNDPHATSKLERLNLTNERALVWRNSATSQLAAKLPQVADWSELQKDPGLRKKNGVYMFDSAGDLTKIKTQGIELTFIVLGNAKTYYSQFQPKGMGAKGVILEDHPDNLVYGTMADFIVPITSMMYHAHQIETKTSAERVAA